MLQRALDIEIFKISPCLAIIMYSEVLLATGKICRNT